MQRRESHALGSERRSASPPLSTPRRSASGTPGTDIRSTTIPGVPGIVRYGVNTLRNTPVWFGANSIPVPYPTLGYVRYDLNTGARHSRKFGTPTKKYPRVTVTPPLTVPAESRGTLHSHRRRRCRENGEPWNGQQRRHRTPLGAKCLCVLAVIFYLYRHPAPPVSVLIFNDSYDSTDTAGGGVTRCGAPRSGEWRGGDAERRSLRSVCVLLSCGLTVTSTRQDPAPLRSVRTDSSP